MLRTSPHARIIRFGKRQIKNTVSSSVKYSLDHGVLVATMSPIKTSLSFFNKVNVDNGPIPTYRVLDGQGHVLDGAEAPELEESLARKIYENMMLLPIMDVVMNNIQRQGKISFYMTSHGEEATVVGSAVALAADDEVLGQYREVGILLWRGFTIDQAMAQCFGNENDFATKGRQMPVHYGSPQHHFHTISSPLATQIPQAAGVGYALKRDRKRRDKNIAVVFFGEGAASEGDFHAGLQLASTIPAPTLFLARNNGFAISTPSTEQFYGDGIASRGPGYGIDTIRVDGNDVLAVINAVTAARQRCLQSGRAVLLEAMSYRVGHHSTSDDSFAYRKRDQVEERKRIDNPLVRYRSYLQNKGWWSDIEEEDLKTRLRRDVLSSLKRAEASQKWGLKELFADVYEGGEPWNIEEQRKELADLLSKYGDIWPSWKSELQKFKGAGSDLKS